MARADGRVRIADVPPAEQVRVVPANEASWEDIQAVLGTRDYAARCQCQRLEVAGWICPAAACGPTTPRSDG
jgi:hypothetical protein